MRLRQRVSLTDELTSLNDAWEALRRLWSWPQRDLPRPDECQGHHQGLCQLVPGVRLLQAPCVPWRIWAQINTPAWSWKLKSLQYSSTIYDSSTEEYLIRSSWAHIVACGKGNAKYWEGWGTLVIVNGSCWFCLSRIGFNCIKISSDSQWLFSYWWLHHHGAGIATHTDE